MPDVRDRIESQFERFAGLIYTHRYLALVVMLALTALMASGLGRVTLDTSTEGFLRDDDPIRIAYDRFKDQFGRDDVIIIAVDTPELWTKASLARLRSLHRDLENGVPHLNEITSLINARNTVGRGDRLEVGELLEDEPQTEADIAKVKKRALANPIYKNQMISEDGRFTALILEIDAYSTPAKADDPMAGLTEDGGQKGGDDLAGLGETVAKPGAKPQAKPEFLTAEETRDAVGAVKDIVARHRADDFKLYVAGSPAVTTELKDSMIRDMSKFMRLVVLIIGLCLLLMFRRISGVIYPLVIVGLTLIATVGLMGRFGVPIKMPTMILPSLLLAVGVGASVHVLALFYQALQRTGDRRAAIIEALGHSGLAIVITSLTTAAGLASFATAEVAPIADLGVFASLGVMLSLIMTVVMLPIFLAIFPIKPKKLKPGQTHQAGFDRFLDRVADFSTGHAKGIIAISIIIILVSAWGASLNKFTHHVLEWLPKDMPSRAATVKIDDRMRGTVSAEIIIDTGRENGLYDRETLLRLDRLAQDLAKIDQGDLYVGKAWSMADMLKEIHQALNENRPEFYKIPDNQALIPQELLLFSNSGSDDLEKVTDSRYQLARFTVKFPWVDAVRVVPFLSEIENRFKEQLGDRAQIEMTGILVILSQTITAAIHSAAKSYLIAFGVITLLMIALIGRLKLGVLSMLPNLAPILVTLAVMGWFRLPFDMYTMMVGSIAIGLAVDNTVHFMHNFRRYFDQTGDAVEAVRMTLHTAGRAMLVTSVVLAAGFFILMFASMNNIFYFGLLTGTAVMLALLADFLMAPALVVLVHGRSKQHDQPASAHQGGSEE